MNEPHDFVVRSAKRDQTGQMYKDETVSHFLLFKGLCSQRLRKGLKRVTFCSKFYENRWIGFVDITMCIFLNV